LHTGNLAEFGIFCHICPNLGEYARIIQVWVFLQLKRRKPNLQILPDLVIFGQSPRSGGIWLGMENGLDNNMAESGRIC
jgi:hypothetical protein